jgi:hypothetical protein
MMIFKNFDNLDTLDNLFTQKYQSELFSNYCGSSQFSILQHTKISWMYFYICIVCIAGIPSGPEVWAD